MRIISLLLIVIAFLSCKEDKKPITPEVKIIAEVSSKKESYPESFSNILESHGGLSQWKLQRTLSFIKPTSDGFEHYTIDLRERKEKVVSENIERGFDGENVWLLDPEKEFKGDAVFYNNLYFYFYSMPFVFADKGVNYNKTNDLVVNDQSFPGIKISFGDGIGTSPKDEYYLHYNPDTNEMAWLGYTVTYRTGEKSDKISWIQYNDWQIVSGLKVPKSISWHKTKGGKILDVDKTIAFDNVTLSDKAMENGYYAKPELATVVVGKH
tara:strand:- start:92 stop:892 length:801 start_codon:yes stop_codon:yes gene_type:complete